MGERKQTSGDPETPATVGFPSRAYRALKRAAWLVVSVFYRRLDVEGAEAIDVDRPALLIINHTNNFADPVVVLGKLPGYPRFLAASSWWRFGAVRWVFGLGGVVPIHRQRDGGTAANRSTFAACHDALASGSQLAMFPEGEVHLGPSLLPLKTGAARIVLGAAADAGVTGISVVPVGLVYEDRGRFRSQAAVHVGEPLAVDEWVDRYRADNRVAVRELTDELEHRLRAVTVNHDSWDEAQLVDRAAELAVAEPDSAPRRYARHNDRRRALTDALARVGGLTGERSLALLDALTAHDEARDGIDPLALGTAAADPLRRRRRVAIELGVLTPAAAVGVVTNAPVVASVALMTSVVRQPSWQATVKGAVAFVLSPLVWAGEAFAVRRHGWRAVTAVLVGAPVGGLAWIAWGSRWREWRRLGWHTRATSEQREALAQVEARRSVVAAHVRALLRDEDGDGDEDEDAGGAGSRPSAQSESALTT
ncbi:MAG: 1-acyl-sn-glycerol-3-phosphate acyltransferase [Acidimicrobiia bacterium]